MSTTSSVLTPLLPKKDEKIIKSMPKIALAPTINKVILVKLLEPGRPRRNFFWIVFAH
jgi:hypothetical protein